MTDEVFATVTTSFETRTIDSNVSDGQDAARTVANETIDTVDTFLSQIQGEGDSALTSVLEAINDLGQFKPGAISFDYTIPQYQPTTFELPQPLDLGIAETTITMPETGVFDMNVDTRLPTAITAPAPATVEYPVAPVPELGVVAGAPTAPTVPVLTVPTTPGLDIPAAPTLAALQTPALRELRELADLAVVLPTYEEFDVGPAPEMPVIESLLVEEALKYDPKRRFRALQEMLGWYGDVKQDLLVYINERARRRDDATADEMWTLRGQGLDIDEHVARSIHMRQALQRFNDTVRLQNVAHDTQRSFRYSMLGAHLKEWHQTFDIDDIGVQKASYDTLMFYAGAWLDLFRAATALYNARVSAFAAEVAVYKARLMEAISALEVWQVGVEAVISKTKLNAQQAQIYGVAVDAKVAEASLYEASVQAVAANVEAYRSRMQAFATQAEVARTGLDAYKGTVDAYVGSLAAYKAQYDVYVAKSRSTAALNQLEEAKTSISIAEMQAAGAGSMAVEVELQTKAESLKLAARKLGASFENQKLHNTLESITAQIEGDLGRQQVLEWSANAQINVAENDAIATEAQAAARYYNAASDASFRATEQAFRAVISSSQASNIAQDSASRVAASVAQGAYSALNLSASVTGSGRVSGEESQDARQSSVISDFLDYDESYQQILSA